MGHLYQWGSYGNETGQFNNTHALGIDNSGRVYVADRFNDRIQVFNSTGGYLDQWGSYGDENGEFKEPHGIAVNSSGFVFVTDRYNNRVQIFTPGWEYLDQWGSIRIRLMGCLTILMALQ